MDSAKGRVDEKQLRASEAPPRPGSASARAARTGPSRAWRRTPSSRRRPASRARRPWSRAWCGCAGAGRGRFRRSRRPSDSAGPDSTPGQASASGRWTSSYQRLHSASTSASTSAVTISRQFGQAHRHSSCTSASRRRWNAVRQVCSRGEADAHTGLVGRRRFRAAGRGRCRRATGADAAQGRHDPHDRRPMPRASAASIRTPRRAPRTTSSTRRSIARSTTGIPPTTSWCSSSPSRCQASDDGLVYTYKLRDDAYFHNGRKMTADDMIWSYTRIMDGSKGYPGARYIRLIKGATEVEKGAGQGDLRPQEDRRLHARDDDHRPRRSRLLLLRRHHRDPAQGRGREGQLRRQSGRPRAVQVQGAHPGQPRRRRALRQVLQARQALRRPARSADHGRGRRARRRLPQQGDRHLDPRARRSTSPIAPIRSSPRASSRSPRCSPARSTFNPRRQAVQRQAGAPGDQLRDRHRPDHQAAGQGQGLSRDELAAALLGRRSTRR